MSARYRNIARVLRAHGTKGEVVAVPLRGLPPLLEEGMRVCLTPPALDRDRWCTVGRAVPFGDGGQLVAFSGIDGLDAAERIAGTWVLACADHLDLEPFELRDDEVVGRAVVDEAAGDLGTVTDVLCSPAHDIWVVSGAFGEVMVPVVDEFVREVPEEGPIRVAIPSGLLDL